MTTLAPMTTAFRPVCDLQDLPVGLGRAYEVDGQSVAVFRTREGKVFASGSHCPHRQGPLADGMLVGDQIVCPFHAFRFDSASGSCDQEGVCAIPVFPVEVTDNKVKIQLPVSA